MNIRNRAVLPSANADAAAPETASSLVSKRLRLLVGLLLVSLLGSMTAPTSEAGPSQLRSGLVVAALPVDRGEGIQDDDIFTFGLGLASPRRILDQGFFQGHPSWAPDGRSIAFASYSGIQVMRPDGGRIRLVLGHRRKAGLDLYPLWPSWSPDGTRLVFSEMGVDEDDRWVSASIQTVRLDGTGRRTLAEFDHLAYMPRWSPDGRTVTFFTCPSQDLIVREDLDCLLYTVRPDGSRLVKHTDYIDPYDLYPAWAADGTIIFVSVRSCREASRDTGTCPSIYRMNADGTDAEMLAPPTDWTGDGLFDPVVRVEPGQDPSRLLVLVTSGAPSAETSLWLWDPATDARKLVSSESMRPEFSWQPLCNVKGSASDDVLKGTPGRDLMCGLGGDDLIRGLGGDDVIFGHAGRDTIVGGAGRDIVVGNGGRDRCDREEKDYSRVC